MMAQHNSRTIGDFFPFPHAAEHKQLSVNDLVIDSRQVKPGDAFVAFPGVHEDGRRYAADALAAGAVVVIAETPQKNDQPQWLANLTEAQLICVPELSAKLGVLAAAFFDNPSKDMHITAITGTNGKTSVCHLLAQAWQQMALPAALLGTLGNGQLEALEPSPNTTLNGIDLQRLLKRFNNAGWLHVAMEASSHGLALGRLDSTTIKIAVITNVSRDHLDFHETMEAYIAAKATLLEWPGLQYAVINRDDPTVVSMCTNIDASVQRLYFSEQGNDGADVWAEHIRYSRGGIDFNLCYADQHMSVHVPLIGAFNISNVLAVCAVLIAQQQTLARIKNVLATLSPVPGRMNLITVPERLTDYPTVVVDYAHTPDALEKALAAVRLHATGKVWCVFGCGGNRDTGKRSQMGAIAERDADHVVITGDNPRFESPERIQQDILSGVKQAEHCYCIADRSDAIAYAISNAAVEDWILLAGKGHEDYQEIEGQRMPFSDSNVAIEHIKQQDSKVKP